MSMVNRNPEQTDDIASDREALAPYNFVPLPTKVVLAEEFVSRDRYHAGRHSGHFVCTVTAETPLYIRAGLTVEEQAAGRQAKEKSAFFSFDPASGAPAVPGSSLRGLLRALVEIVGYGKMTRVSKTPLVYRAVDTTALGKHYRAQVAVEERRNFFVPQMRGGYLEQAEGRWQIRPAQQINGTSFARIADRLRLELGRLRRLPQLAANTFAIFIEPGPYAFQPVRGDFLQIKYAKVLRAAAQEEAGLVASSLLISGKMNTKRSEAVIFPPDDAATPISVPDDLIEAYRAQISKEQALLLDWPQERNSANYTPTGLLRHGQPLFYLMDGATLRAFGHTMMLRIPYQRTPYDFVPAALRRESDVDIAEALFGFVRDQRVANGEQARAGRVYVGDATAITVQPLRNTPLTPHILASPKPTTFQHYLVQTSDTKDELKHYGSRPETDTVIRGHKLYWHKGPRSADDLEDQAFLEGRQQEDALDTQHTQIEALDAGSSFRFTLRFENVSDVELGALLWVLQLCDDDKHPDRQYRLKLGMGKPLGMGAVRLAIESSQIVDHQARYRNLFNSNGDAWAHGATPLEPTQIEAALRAFETYVLNNCGETKPKSGRLADTLRMQMLLAMLSWPGPQQIAYTTRYMEIERMAQPRISVGKNEYRERPVLPTPLSIDEQERRRKRAQVQPTPQPQEAPLDAPTRPFEGRPRGEVWQAATASERGVVEYGGRRYYYEPTDVTGAVPQPGQKVRFVVDRRKVSVGKEKKYLSWATAVELDDTSGAD
jgi:CRISPR-associated protein (TIGR03986 family)